MSTGEALAGQDIEPDPGSTNPFLVGANRLAEPRSFTLHVLAEDAPADPHKREKNILYAGKDGGELQFVTRIYLSDEGWDGAGWGPASSLAGDIGFPTYEGILADGTKLGGAQAVEQFARPITGATRAVDDRRAVGGACSCQGQRSVTRPCHRACAQSPQWEKYWTLKYSIVGASRHRKSALRAMSR